MNWKPPKKKTRSLSNWKISRASTCIRDGGIIAYPTEAIFGLGCDPANPKAVAHLLAIKHRPVSKGLILVAAHRAQLDPWLQTLPASLEQRLQRRRRNATTWLAPAAADCPVWLTGQHRTLAIRISTHPLIQALCQSLDSALVSTSANTGGHPPARSILEVQLAFATGVDYILSGPLGGRQHTSTIRDLVSGRTVRP